MPAKRQKTTSKKKDLPEESSEDVEMVVPETQFDPPEASELKRLKQQLRLKTEALAEITNQYQSLRELRTTRPEQNEAELSKIADERQKDSANMIQEYKRENDELRLRLVELEQRGPSSTSESNQEQRVTRLEIENQALAEKLEKEQASNTRKIDKLNSEKEEHLKNLQTAENEIKELQTILDTEAEHSKKLQAQLKAATANANSRQNVVVPVAKPSQPKTEDGSREKLDLYEELTGLVILGKKDTDTSTTYNCMIQANSIELSFKLNFTENVVVYIPDVEPARDPEIYERLEAPYRERMKFDPNALSKFYKRLFKQVHGL